MGTVLIETGISGKEGDGPYRAVKNEENQHFGNGMKTGREGLRLQH